MKVLIGTDFHGNEAMFESFAAKAEEERAEIIVVCGDLTHFGNLTQAQHLLSVLIAARVPVLFVPGNCDPPSLVGVDIEGAKCIHGASVSYGEMTFLGVGGSPPTPFSTPFEVTEEEMLEALNHASANLGGGRWIVLVLHTPPFNTGLDKTGRGRHVGSVSVRRFIEETKPSVVFCGHIHEAKGKDRIVNTILVNPGPARHGDYVIALFDEYLTIEFHSL